MSTLGLREKVSNLILSYLMNGGQMAQITTADVEELKEAQKNPDAYSNLIVRVGGYSCLFNDLDEAAQNEIISRYAV